jgi:hypothetical protein
MRKFKNINSYLKTVSPEERESLQWNIERMVVEYWELLTGKSQQGEDYGKITIPVENEKHYLVITLHLKWEGWKLHAIIEDVRVLDTVEWIGS